VGLVPATCQRQLLQGLGKNPKNERKGPPERSSLTSGKEKRAMEAGAKNFRKPRGTKKGWGIPRSGLKNRPWPKRKAPWGYRSRESKKNYLGEKTNHGGKSCSSRQSRPGGGSTTKEKASSAEGSGGKAWDAWGKELHAMGPTPC